MFEVSDTSYDDFLMFRYELQTIFSKHQFIDEKKNDVFLLGAHPLSKRNGRLIKDLNTDHRQNCLDMYVPPGIIRCKQTKIQQQSKLPKYIRQAQPSDTIYIR